MNLEYSHFPPDKIRMTGSISNLKEFLSLDAKKRKNLLKECLAALKQYLSFLPVYGKGSHEVKRLLQNSDIIIQLFIGEIIEDEKGRLIRTGLVPFKIIGLAGYTDGKFIFSENYYLKLEVKGNIAITKTEDKIVIEEDQDKFK